MRVALNTANFEKQLNNIVNYSIGFLDGAQAGKKVFLDNLGKSVIFMLGKYIDAEARSNRMALHHVYEWYETGSPEARLFNLNYTVSNVGLSVSSTFRQSTTVSRDGNKPFYDKARIMERGIPVTISPSPGSVLRFTESGNEVFTKRPVTVFSPGGDEVQGSFGRVFDEFMTRYFSQIFLRASGLTKYLSNPTVYKKDLPEGAKIGKSRGIATGYRWITNAKIEVE